MAWGISKSTAYVLVGIAAIAALILIARSFYPVDRTVTITYYQHAQCGGYVTGTTGNAAPTVVSASPGAYVFFKIKEISNKAKNARDFLFDPDKLFVIGQPKATAYTNASFQPLQPFLAAPMTVPRGQVRAIDIGGYAVAVVYGNDGPDPSALAAQKDYRLAADPTGIPGQEIKFTKGGSGPPWGAANSDCSAIQF